MVRDSSGNQYSLHHVLVIQRSTIAHLERENCELRARLECAEAGESEAINDLASALSTDPVLEQCEGDLAELDGPHIRLGRRQLHSELRAHIESKRWGSMAEMDAALALLDEVEP